MNTKKLTAVIAAGVVSIGAAVVSLILYRRNHY